MKALVFLFCYGSIVLATLEQHPKQLQSEKHDYGILYRYNDSLQYETYMQYNGWGYRIYLRYKLRINQPNIPALSGNIPFKNEADARAVARLMSSKIAQGQMPPTLSIEEIQNLLNPNNND